MASLSPTDHARIDAAVKAAENRTSAEFAVVIAQASDHYTAFPLLWSAVLALVAGGAIALTLPNTNGATTFAVQAIVFVALGFTLHIRPLRVRLVPPTVAREHASRLARLQFAALVHNRTYGDVGLLLFVSLAERHVEIQIDRGIAERIPESVWRNIIDGFVVAVRHKHVADGVIAAVERCTSILEKDFPATQSGQNEIVTRVTEV